MHSAFCPSLLLTLSKSITAVHAYSNKLIVADSSGTLSIHSISEPDETYSVSATVTKTLKNFTRRPIEQMSAIKETSMLIILSDSYISIYDLESMQIQQRLDDTKGATSFAMFTCITHDSGIPVLITQLCILVKKKALIYTWNDTEFLDTVGFNLSDRARTATFVSRSRLIIGCNTEWFKVDLDSAAVTSISLSDPLGSVPTGLGYLGTKAPKLLITKLAAEEALLVKDLASFFLDSSGVVTSRKTLNWPSAPEAIGFTFPFIIVAVKNKIEVRSCVTGTLLQNIDLSGCVFVNDGKALVVATVHKIYFLSLIPYEEQIAQMISADQLSESIELLQILDPVLLTDKEGQIRQVKRIQAQLLFAKHQFLESMDLFSEASALPSEVVQLFTPMVSGGAPVQDDDQDQINETEVRNNLFPISRSSIDSVSLREPTVLATNAASSPKNGMKALDIVSEEETLNTAMRALASYLADARRKLSRFIHAPPSEDETFAFRTSSLPHRLLTVSEMEKEAEIADTCLLQVYIQIQPGLVSSLVRLANRCDPAIVKDYLVKQNRWRELIDFYYGKGLHASSLELLKEHEEVVGTIAYIERLDERYWDVIKTFSAWILERAPAEAINIFVERSIESESLPRSKVVEHLDSFGDGRLSIQYLEHIIFDLSETSPELHNRLSRYYIKLFNKPTYREKLARFLGTSESYSPEQILGYIPNSNQFVEVRAILLGKMGQHRKALEIYAFRLQEPAKAENYCVKLFPTQPDIFELLLGLYLQPPAGEKVLLQAAISLISVHGPRLDAEKILSLVPDRTYIADIESFFEGRMRENLTSLNSTRIESTLRKSSMLRVQLEVIEQRNRKFTIGKDRVCPNCHKRLGNSAIAIFPDGGVVHYGCQRNYVATRNLDYHVA